MVLICVVRTLLSLAGKHMKLIHEKEKSEYFLIYNTLVYLLFQNHLLKWFCEAVFVEVVGYGHLQVTACCGCLVSVVNSAPIGDHNTVIVPFFTEDRVKEELVLAAVVTVNPVVGSHYGAGAAFEQDSSENLEISVSEDLFIYLRVYTHSFGFLVI